MKKETTYKHYTEASLLSPQHPVTIYLIGCGGTGSQVLNNLARTHKALIALGHPGFHVTVFDNDIVTEANLGRQLFAESELGLNKSTALVTRVNRFFGLQWESMPCMFDLTKHKFKCNFLITAVDKVKIRMQIGEKFNKSKEQKTNEFYANTMENNYYWIDIGNSKTSGQIVLGTRGKIEQPKKTLNTIDYLPCITTMFPDLQKHEDKDKTPSCSLAEALDKQDLFINSIMAQYACNMLWKMFKEASLDYHGLYVNLETMNTNPIKVK